MNSVFSNVFYISDARRWKSNKGFLLSQLFCSAVDDQGNSVVLGKSIIHVPRYRQVAPSCIVSIGCYVLTTLGTATPRLG